MACFVYFDVSRRLITEVSYGFSQDEDRERGSGRSHHCARSLLRLGQHYNGDCAWGRRSVSGRNAEWLCLLWWGLRAGTISPTGLRARSHSRHSVDIQRDRQYEFTGGTPTDPPDGDGFFGTGAPSNNGMGAVNAPLDSLLGVFLNNSLPSSSAAPAGLDFSPASARSFTSLAPGLKQVFFIGDGLTGNGTGSVQKFIVPNGATRLFLGGGDAFGWFNNSGSFTVKVNPPTTAVVPEPGTLWLLGTGLIGFLARRKL